MLTSQFKSTFVISLMESLGQILEKNLYFTRIFFFKACILIILLGIGYMWLLQLTQILPFYSCVQIVFLFFPCFREII